jgi:hypothetical protein
METIYTEAMGTTCYINGERGTVTGLWSTCGHVTGAFVALDERPAMLYVMLGAKTGDRGQYHETTSAREIDREEFDRINGLDTLRRELGWAA